MYLLDTNVVSELRRRDRADTGVAAWVDGIDADTLFVSVVTILELEMGVPRWSDAIRHRAHCCVAGSRNACCPHSTTGSCRSIFRWRAVALGFTSRTDGPNGMR